MGSSFQKWCCGLHQKQVLAPPGPETAIEGSYAAGAVLQRLRCYSPATALLQPSYSPVTALLQLCYSPATALLQLLVHSLILNGGRRTARKRFKLSAISCNLLQLSVLFYVSCFWLYVFPLVMFPVFCFMLFPTFEE